MLYFENNSEVLHDQLYRQILYNVYLQNSSLGECILTRITKKTFSLCSEAINKLTCNPSLNI